MLKHYGKCNGVRICVITKMLISLELQMRNKLLTALNGRTGAN